MDKFFMVWKLGGGGPKFQHPGVGEAAIEAARLSALNPWDTFYVLKSVGEPVGPQRTDARPEPPKKQPKPTAQTQSPLTPEQKAEREARRAQKRADYEARTGKKATTEEKPPTTLASIRRETRKA